MAEKKRLAVVCRRAFSYLPRLEDFFFSDTWHFYLFFLSLDCFSCIICNNARIHTKEICLRLPEVASAILKTNSGAVHVGKKSSLNQRTDKPSSIIIHIRKYVK